VAVNEPSDWRERRDIGVVIQEGPWCQRGIRSDDVVDTNSDGKLRALVKALQVPIIGGTRVERVVGGNRNLGRRRSIYAVSTVDET